MHGKSAKIWAVLLAIALNLFSTGCVRHQYIEAQNSGVESAKDLDDDANIPKVNINTATVGELRNLPGVGAELAGRIIEHREKYGRFERPEHLLMVRGISDRLYRKISRLITTQ